MTTERSPSTKRTRLSASLTRRRRSSGWPSGSSSWGCLVLLRCASAGCLLLRRSLSASSALSSSFVTILSLISSHSPGLSTAKVRKTWRSPQVCSLRSSSRSAWSNMLTMVIGRLPLTFGASSRCRKYCSIHSRAGRSLSCRSAFPRKSNLILNILYLINNIETVLYTFPRPFPLLILLCMPCIFIRFIASISSQAR